MMTIIMFLKREVFMTSVQAELWCF